MKSFSDLLAEYIQRVGVSDAELARRLGVSRQTIFRWREGRTRRPRHREDVTRLASKLRLTREETASLLLAAGFQPDEPHHPLLQEADEIEGWAHEQKRERKTSCAVIGVWRSHPVLRWSIILIAIAGLVAAYFVRQGTWPSLSSPLPPGMDRQPRPAGPDETLILISEFVNYGGEQIGYNLAGRLQETMVNLVQESGVKGVRVERLDEPVIDEGSAKKIGQDFNADIVVWGEYDTGRVVAVVSAPEEGSSVVSRERRWHVKTVEELSTRINGDVPSDVSWISLYVLGRALFLADRTEQAEAVFQRVLNEPIDNHATRASVYFSLGRIEAGKEASNPDKVIAYYTEALELRPDMVQALNNRGVAYLKRESVGDLTRAEADFERALAIDSTLGDTRLNLALTLIRQDPDHLSEVIALLEEAVVLQPESPGIQNGLCWYLSLAGRPEEALPHCDEAVELDGSGYSNDSRGLALAMLARYEEAVAEFELFLEIIEREDREAYDHFTATRWSWIEALESGKNPFTEAVLNGLLEE